MDSDDLHATDCPEVRVLEILGHVEEGLGWVPAVLRRYGVERPAGFLHWFARHTALHEGSPGLDHADRELIALVVSSRNRCSYCVHSHRANFTHLTGDAALAETVAIDYRQAHDLDTKRRAIADFAAALTDEPARVPPEAANELAGNADLSPQEVWDVIELVAMYNFINRVTLALGLTPEDDPAVGATTTMAG